MFPKLTFKQLFGIIFLISLVFGITSWAFGGNQIAGAIAVGIFGILMTFAVSACIYPMLSLFSMLTRQRDLHQAVESPFAENRLPPQPIRSDEA